MNETVWIRRADEQLSELVEETAMVSALLDEALSYQAQDDNRRRTSNEIENITEYLNLLDGERRRVAEEIRILEAGESFDRKQIAARREQIGAQAEMVQQHLTEWRQTNDQGLRRRRRDRRWLDALMLASARLGAESRRISEEARGPVHA